MTAPLASSQWNYPTQIHFASNGIKQLSNHLHKLSCTRPLLICDQFLLTQPNIQVIIQSIKESNINLTLFSNFEGNPTSHHVNDAIYHCRQLDPDCIIGLGGGSAIDIAKIVAVASRSKADLWDFIDNNSPRPSLDDNQALPIIAIPTTAGTGSEVSHASLITHVQDRTKHILFHPHMLPKLVICDPLLTLSLPPHLTAWTGFDALAHNLEALCSPQFHPQAEGIAMEGIRLIHESFITACNNGTDTQARSNMMCASLMGASAFQKGLGAIHSLSHPVGGLFNAHHGLLNAIFMPTVLRYNQPYIADKMNRLARYLNLPNPGHEAILDWVESLLKESKTPTTLAAINIDDKQAALIAKHAFADPSTASNPRPMSIHDCEALFRSALHGDYSLIPKAKETQ